VPKARKGSFVGGEKDSKTAKLSMESFNMSRKDKQQSRQSEQALTKLQRDATEMLPTGFCSQRCACLPKGAVEGQQG